MFELASVPQELGEIVVQGIRLGRLTFRRLFTLTSVLAFMGLIPTVVQVWGAGDEVSFDFPTMDSWLQQFNGPYGISAAMVTLLSLFLQAILLKRIAAATRGQIGPLAMELRQALRVWPWMVLALFIYAIAVALGCLLLLVPGLILAISLMFNGFAVVLDGLKPLPALNASHNLVWGHWWRTLGLLVLIYLPLFVLMAIAASILGIDVGSMGDAPLRGRDLFEEAVLEMVFLAVFSPFVYSIMYLYYHDLKLRKQQQ